MVQALAEVIHL